MKPNSNITTPSSASTNFKVVSVLSQDMEKSMQFYEERMGFKYLVEDNILVEEKIHAVLISKWAEFIIILKPIRIKLISEVVSNRILELRFTDVEEYSDAVMMLDIDKLAVSYESPRLIDPGVPAFIVFEDADKNVWQYTFCGDQ
jgi:hypothetical protein